MAGSEAEERGMRLEDDTCAAGRPQHVGDAATPSQRAPNRCFACLIGYTFMMPRAPSVKWTRAHLLIALNLYCKLPFGRLHRNNPIIVQVAEKMGRTPNSLAMKLCNFASLDPVQKARGIKGLAGASR